MTEQEAIDKLRNIKLYMKIVDSQDHDLQFSNNDYIAIDMAIKALEKQVPIIPTKLIEYKTFSGKRLGIIRECPKCREKIHTPVLHCCRCGQKFDWNIDDYDTDEIKAEILLMKVEDRK